EPELSGDADVGGIPTRFGQSGQAFVLPPFFHLDGADGVHGHRVGRRVDGAVRHAAVGVLVEGAAVVDELESVGNVEANPALDYVLPVEGGDLRTGVVLVEIVRVDGAAVGD